MTRTRARSGLRRPKPQQAWAIARFEEARDRLVQIEQQTAMHSTVPPARDAYVTAHGDELARAASVEDAIAEALRRRVTEVDAFRPFYLVHALGEPPEDDGPRAAWRRAAAVVENHRAELGVDDEGSVFGPEPVGAAEIAAWRGANRDLAAARVSVGAAVQMDPVRELPDFAPDPGIGMEL